jgi:hypothetical protein
MTSPEALATEPLYNISGFRPLRSWGLCPTAHSRAACSAGNIQWIPRRRPTVGPDAVTSASTRPSRDPNH